MVQKSLEDIFCENCTDYNRFQRNLVRQKCPKWFLRRKIFKFPTFGYFLYVWLHPGFRGLNDLPMDKPNRIFSVNCLSMQLSPDLHNGYSIRHVSVDSCCLAMTSLVKVSSDIDDVTKSPVGNGFVVDWMDSVAFMFVKVAFADIISRYLRAYLYNLK